MIPRITSSASFALLQGVRRAFHVSWATRQSDFVVGEKNGVRVRVVEARIAALNAEDRCASTPDVEARDGRLAGGAVLVEAHLVEADAKGRHRGAGSLMLDDLGLMTEKHVQSSLHGVVPSRS